MDEKAARETHALAQKLIDILNASQASTVGLKVDAMAFVSAWMLLSIGGSHNFATMVDLFVQRMSELAINLGETEMALANATHNELLEAIG